MSLSSEAGLEEREAYIRRQAEQQQRAVVSYRTCDSGSSSSSVWAYRTTGCDVLAVITTTLPILDGRMRDIKLNTKETVKLKPPLMKNGKPSPHESPFMDGLVVDVERSRRRISSILKGERRAFLEKLRNTKHLRSALEAKAALVIQTAFRRHFIRCHIQDIVKDRLLKKSILGDIRSYLSGLGLSLSLRAHRDAYSKLRGQAATAIQSIFRRYISGKSLRRKRGEAKEARRTQAATTIQCMARCVVARRFVKLRRAKVNFLRHSAAVLRIQSCFRQILAKRRVRLRRIKFRWIAARMIQCWFRARNSRKMCKSIKEFMVARRLHIGALRMQCLVRKFLSIRRVNRIRFRRLFKRIFHAAARIQSAVRKFLSKFYIKRVKTAKAQAEESRKEAETAAAQLAQDLAKEAELRQHKETFDILGLAYQGNTARVEDLFGELRAGCENPLESCINGETGDSLLSIAAETGNLDLVRKCLLWGFDVNHRNYAGQNSLLIATKHHHIHVVQYLLTPAAGETRAPNATLEPVLDDDAYLLLTYAMSGPLASAKASGGRPFALVSALLHHGLNVNVQYKDTGMTPLLFACENGLVDGVKFLLKQRASTDAIDESGQSVFHKCAKSSPELIKGFLGIDSSLGIVIPEGTRASYVLKPDGNGKDCALLAALHGQQGVLDIIHDLVQKTAVDLLPPAYSSLVAQGSPMSIIFAQEDVEIGWSPADIQCALLLAANNDASCLSKVIEAGFDLSWSDESTGARVMHVAAKVGASEVLDLCFSKEADFSLLDSRGRNVLHYAAINKSGSILAQLFSNPKGKDCSFSPSLLSSQEYDRGDTPLHIIAREGGELSIELLARSGLEAALTVKNYSGMTPLLLACSYLRHGLISLFMELGCDVKTVDSKGRSAIWHLFHPVICANNVNNSTSSNGSQASPLSARKLRGPICSELVSRKGSLSRRERDDANQSLQKDIDVISSLLRAGTPFFSSSSLLVSVDKMLALPSPPNRPQSASSTSSGAVGAGSLGISSAAPASTSNSGTTASGSKLESFALSSSVLSYNNPIEELLDSGDIAVKELSMGLLKLLPALITPKECWRLLLSCIRFDDGSGKLLLSLLEGGAIDLLVQGDASSPKRGPRTAPLSAVVDERPGSASGITESEVSRLQNAFFGGLTVAGWCIRLGNISSLQQLVRRGYNVQSPVDMLGNSCLHLIASQTYLNVGSMIDIVLTDSRARIESRNYAGQSPSMICAKNHSFVVFKKLYNKGVDCRDALRGRYVSWILAFAKRRERREILTQTGRYGSDDSLYFPLYPDPDHLIWVK